MTTTLDFTPASINVGELANVFNSSLDRCLSPRLDSLKGKKVIFGSTDKTVVPIDGWGFSTDGYSMTISKIIPFKESMIVAAVDSSSVQIAETDDGTLYAVKAGIAMAYGGHALMHFKIGPILFYLSEETIGESEIDHRLAKLILFDNDAAKRLIRIRVERAIQMLLSNHFKGSIILVDGSLKHSLYESKEETIKKIAENCVLRKNSIIGISKSTRLKIIERISSALNNTSGPACMDIGLFIKSLSRNTIGINNLVKFEANNTCPILRADIIGAEGLSGSKILGRLIGNDSIANGYPETLRLSHHISTFATNEISCLKSHILSRYNVTEILAEDIRRTLLGSIPI